MKRANGWVRIGILLSLIWFASALGVILKEYSDVDNGASPRYFILLTDMHTGKSFGLLNKREVAEYTELEAELGHKKADQQILHSDVHISIIPLKTICWIFLPIVFLWFFYFSILWIAAGFNRNA